jgi:Zn/Cd-binding protein ZinT
MLDQNNHKEKMNNELKFFYNNTLFKDLEKNKISGIKKLVTFVEKSLNGSISISSSRGSVKKYHRGNTIVEDRHKMVT